MNEEQLKQWIRDNIVLERDSCSWGSYCRIALRILGDDEPFDYVSISPSDIGHDG